MHTFALGLFSLLGLSLLNPANAADLKFFSGTTCVPDNSLSDRVQYSPNGIYNIASYSQRVYCAGLKDTGTINTSSWVYVTDQHYSSNISCVLLNVDPSTGSMRYSSARSSGSNSTPQKLRFGSVTHYGEGPSLVQCDLPGTYAGRPSSVQAIKFDER